MNLTFIAFKARHKRLFIFIFWNEETMPFDFLRIVWFVNITREASWKLSFPYVHILECSIQIKVISLFLLVQILEPHILRHNISFSSLLSLTWKVLIQEDRLIYHVFSEICFIYFKLGLIVCLKLLRLHIFIIISQVL